MQYVNLSKFLQNKLQYIIKLHSNTHIALIVLNYIFLLSSVHRLNDKTMAFYGLTFTEHEEGSKKLNYLSRGCCLCSAQSLTLQSTTLPVCHSIYSFPPTSSCCFQHLRLCWDVLFLFWSQFPGIMDSAFHLLSQPLRNISCKT